MNPSGDDLRRHYARQLAAISGGDEVVERCYMPHLHRFPTDEAVRREANALLADRLKLWDVLAGFRKTP